MKTALCIRLIFCNNRCRKMEVTVRKRSVFPRGVVPTFVSSTSCSTIGYPRHPDATRNLRSRSLRRPELNTKYHYTEETSSSAKLEANQLREEVKSMSAQLLRQHNASLESQVLTSRFDVSRARSALAHWARMSFRVGLVCMLLCDTS